LRLVRGAHRVELQGPLPAAASVALPLPLPPHRATAALEGWAPQGLRPDGGVEGALQLVRDAPAEPGAEPGAAPTLPPFLRVLRSFDLRPHWPGGTCVRR